MVVNPSAGPALKSTPTQTLREGLPDAEIIELEDPADLTQALERAVSAGARALGVSGGDGSVNAAATIAIREGLPLLVVPGGTLNHLAKALGLDSA
ncbi:MAG: diacylglycerol/lipid kinase family protein, partial [Acidimicrobiales bacterium]